MASVRRNYLASSWPGVVVQSVTVDSSREMIDVTTFGDAERQYVPGIARWEARMELVITDQLALDRLLALLDDPAAAASLPIPPREEAVKRRARYIETSEL